MTNTALSLYPKSRELTDNTILIGGPGRSGTRILGSLFDSLVKTEYAFEPLMLYALIPAIETMAKDDWRLQFETYLVEEFLFNALAGRFLNFNENDYSCVRMSKSDAEIADRLGRTRTRNEILEAAHERRIVIKVPDLSPFMAGVMDYYRGINLLVMLRKPESVIGSFVRKRSYSDQSLLGPWTYPPYRREGDFFLPSWIAPADAKEFTAMNPVERCCYVYARGYENLPRQDRVTVVDYDDFVTRPAEIFGDLCRRYGRRFGPKTEKILGLVKEPEKDRHFSWEQVDPGLRRRVYDAFEDMKSRVGR